MSKYSLRRCEDTETWDRFVASSPHGSVFCRSWLLGALCETAELWLLEDAAGRVVAGVPILVRDGAPLPAPYPYTIYQGPMLAPKCVELPPHRRYSVIVKVLEALIIQLADRYGSYSFSLHHAHDDLRALQWHNYGAAGLPQFQLKPQYTGLLDLRKALEFSTWLRSVRDCRRQEFKKAAATGLSVRTSTDYALLNRLHALTFGRQGLERSDEHGRLIERVAKCAQDLGSGEMLLCETADGRPCSAILFLWHGDTAYYLIGANDPDCRQLGAGTFLMLKGIERLAASGFAELDVVGVNSPRRGDFKLSFNAVPRLYFDAELAPVRR